MMGQPYSFIYRELVESEDDLVGLIAYGIYKKHKIEFIRKIKSEQNREPETADFESFCAASTTKSQLSSYRNQAEAMLSETLGNIADAELRRYEEEMLKNYRKEISSCIPSNISTFTTSIIAGVVSTLLFTLVAGIFYFIGETSDRSTRNKTLDLMENVTGTAQDSLRMQEPVRH